MSSPAISVEALFLTCLIGTMEHRTIVTCDIPGASIQSNVDELIHRLNGEITELLVKVDLTYQQFRTEEQGQPVIYAELNKALYGTLQAAVLFLQNLSKFLIEEHGFTLALQLDSQQDD